MDGQVLYKVHFSQLCQLDMKLLIDTFKKIANLNAKDLQRVKVYVERTTNHGQTKVENLLGTKCKSIILFVLSGATDVDQLEGGIEAYNRKVTAFNDKLNIAACHCAVDIEELNGLKKELVAQYNYLYCTAAVSRCISYTMPTADGVELCMDCKSMIRTAVTARDMTVEELEKEKNEVAIEQDRLDSYDCNSSFCFGSCSRCKHRSNKIVPGTKMIRQTETCLCGSQHVSAERPNRI